MDATVLLTVVLCFLGLFALFFIPALLGSLYSRRFPTSWGAVTPEGLVVWQESRGLWRTRRGADVAYDWPRVRYVAIQPRRYNPLSRERRDWWDVRFGVDALDGRCRMTWEDVRKLLPFAPERLHAGFRDALASDPRW